MITSEEAKLDMMQHLGLAPKPAPRVRVQRLPPQAAPCGLVMDGDRLPLHKAQCLACAAGVQAASYAGIDRTTAPPLVQKFVEPPIKCCHPGASSGGHLHSEMCPKAGPEKMVPVPLPAVIAPPPVCVGKTFYPEFICFGPRAPRHMDKTGPVLVCEGHYLHVEALRSASAGGVMNMLRDADVPERLPRRPPPPLVHSFGVEDPALPDA